MEIKTITCHDVYNYGASLQAFALQYFLQNQGHNVEIIDYKPEYLSFPYRISMFVHPHSPVRKYTDRSALLRFMYAVKRYLWYLPSFKRKLAFDNFTSHYLNQTRRYVSYQELLADIPSADVYISGSDQVWNSVTMLNGKDPAFYLQFAPSGKKRISYAASFGATSISKDCGEVIQHYLSSFDAVSVRETSGLDILTALSVSGVQVCDPVFLLSADEWRKVFEITSEEESYVLIYNLTAVNQKLVDDARYVARKLGVRLYSISPIKIKGVDRNFTDLGPSDFVRMIFNSRFVFTNSFHATAFSIIAHKQFCTYNYHSTSNSSRMHSILDQLGMLDRLNVEDISTILDSPVDYKVKETHIQECMSEGKGWLLNNL